MNTLVAFCALFFVVGVTVGAGAAFFFVAIINAGKREDALRDQLMRRDHNDQDKDERSGAGLVRPTAG
jgi:hypothetical protein